VAGTLLAVAALGYASWPREPEPDPNYVRARDAVLTYEIGKDEGALNFDDPVYPEALQTLARVAPESISAPPAEQLVARIRQSMDAFHLRLKARQEGQVAQEEKLQKRFQAEMMAGTQARLTPHLRPECIEDEDPHSPPGKDGHGH
jgi:hypothetical protein